MSDIAFARDLIDDARPVVRAKFGNTVGEGPRTRDAEIGPIRVY
jgi:hypothetical protein